jgi:D-alanyl-D-alanine carboxypeptidase
MFYENIQTVNNLAGAQQSVSIYTQELNSEYTLLIEAESGSGQVILSKNSNKKMFPASMFI